MKRTETGLHPALEAICRQLGLSPEAVRSALEEADRRELAPGDTPPALTSGHDLAAFVGAWDMSGAEWEEISRDLLLMRRVEGRRRRGLFLGVCGQMNQYLPQSA